MNTLAPHSHGFSSHLRAYWELLRPFTLIAPAVGVVAAAVMATGAQRMMPQSQVSWRTIASVVIGALIGSLLNGASNTINQIFDLEIDRINRPTRPLPSGRISPRGAGSFATVLGSISLLAAWFVGPPAAGHAFFWLALAATVTTFLYSAPPARLKRHWWSANLAIALPRGLLLPVAGWATVSPINVPDPWCLGSILFLFLLGAASTKDFADISGDRACGCQTLPVKLGVQKAVGVMAPFLILPFLLFPLWAWLGLFSGSATVLSVLGVALAAWGACVARMILRRPEDLAVENHPSWLHMYLIMMCALVGSAVAYWV